jgi:hypothetical protein
MKTLFVTLIFLLMSGQASAQQTHFSLDKGDEEWAFEVAWKSAKGGTQSVEFTLAAERIEKDLAVPLQFQMEAANQTIAKAINSYGKETPGVQINAVQEGKGVQISGRGKSRKKLKKAMKGVKRVQRKALRGYMKQHGFTKLKGKVIPNHAQHAYRYADDLQPLAVALGSEELRRRVFAKRALAMVQNIPYEKGRDGRDKGFRLPMSLLAKNRGDCDSKATLYLALLKAAHPTLDTSFIYIKGHAFVGLGLKPKSGDVTFEADGRTWVIAEPVGPALSPIGQAGRKSERKAKRGKIDIRRVKDD